MGFVGNLVFLAVKKFCKLIKVMAMVMVAPFLTHGAKSEY